jgi:predicted nuclease of predicted toxin-antitoxin system
MARTIRFHLDENCNPAIAAGLRARGVDVTTTQDVGLLAAIDERQMDFALIHRRVLVSHDADMVALHE